MYFILWFMEMNLNKTRELLHFIRKIISYFTIFDCHEYAPKVIAGSDFSIIFFK